MQRILLHFMITLLLCGITSCNSGEKSPYQKTGNNNDPKNCTIENILKQVDVILKGQTYETHCLDLNNQYLLSFWILLPELDPTATEHDVYLNSKKAFNVAIKTAYTILSAIPCIPEVFDGINPMIVDENYSLWYRDMFPIQFLLILDKYADEDRMNILTGRRHRDFSYLRVNPVQPKGEVDMSNWPEIRASLNKILHKAKGRPNTAAYPILMDEYSSVQVYCAAKNEKAMEDESLYKKIEFLVELFSKAPVQVEIIQVGFVGIDNMLKKYSIISGLAIRKYTRNRDINLKNIIKIRAME